MASGRTLVNAIIGAVVGVVLSFVPLSTVLGGAVAGFLEGPDGRRGAIVGALAGAITFLPFAVFAMFALGVLGFGMGIVEAPIEGFAVAALAVVGLGLLVFLYTVGLSLLGGYLGAYLAGEYPGERTRTRETIGLSSTERSGSLESTRASGPRPNASWDREGEDRVEPHDLERDRDRESDGNRS